MQAFLNMYMPLFERGLEWLYNTSVCLSFVVWFRELDWIKDDK